MPALEKYTAKARAAFERRLYQPSHLRVYVADVYGIDTDRSDPGDALDRVMAWLARAHDAGDGGVSGYYSFASGWHAPYPETTGYIIPTMLDYAELTGRSDYADRAMQMAEWLLGVQLDSGAFPGGYTDDAPKPIVFNTGQILLGLVRAHEESGDERYLRSAEATGDWLVSIQDADGAWRKCTYRDEPHTYHTRVAWPLLELNRICPKAEYVGSAERFLDWAMSNQLPNGWFEQNVLYFRDDRALTHSIAYAIRGLLESSVLLGSDECLTAAKTASDVLLERFETTGDLQATYDPEWASADDYTCVTGNAQMSCIWTRLHEIEPDPRHRDAARRMNETLRRIQGPSSRNEGIAGGVKGSHPISGTYMSWCFTNWAAKFYADALMFEQRADRGAA